MAGLWVVAVIATWIVVGVVTSSILSLILYLAAKRWMRDLELDGKRLKIICACAPFLGLLWLAIALLLHLEISNRLAHQDCGLSGDPYVTLPNGYVVGSHNTYDGYFVAPGSKTDMPVVGPGYVRSIVDLHYADHYFTGTLFDFNTTSVRSFVYDTRTRAAQLSAPLSANPHATDPFHPDPADLSAWTVANDEAQTGSNSYWKIYRRYRHHWPSYILLAMILSGEGAIASWVRTEWRKQPIQATPSQ